MTVNRGLLGATALAAVGVYLLMWVGFTWQWGWLADVDAWALQPTARFGQAHPGWVTGWDVFCTALGPFAFRFATLVVIVVAFVRRRVRVAVFLIVAVELSGLVTEIAKALAERPRPDTAFVDAYGLSFPSGHALGVTAAVLALYVVARPVLRPRWRPWTLGAAVLLIVLMGAARVVLNVHHPSDVVAGWALGYAYFAACLLAVPPYRPRVTEADETPAVSGTAP